MQLRARYKQGPARRSPFPELRFQRFECNLGKPLKGSEDADKCQAIKRPCWQDDPQLLEAALEAIAAREEPKEE